MEITRQILFILLVTVSEPTTHFFFPFSNDYIDTWSTHIPNGDLSSPGQAHYKAILFFTKEALDKYLEEHDCHNCILIDIKKGKQYRVRQQKLMKEVIERKEVLDKYESEIILMNE